MCLCAVTIRNPKIKAGTFLVSVDKEYINVPCGHCSECINAKRRDLTFRAYYEYLNCGLGFFRCNSDFLAQNCIKESRFTNIRSTDNCYIAYFRHIFSSSSKEILSSIYSIITLCLSH